MLFLQMPPQFLDVFGFRGGFFGDGVDVDERSGHEALGAVEALALVVEGFGRKNVISFWIFRLKCGDGYMTYLGTRSMAPGYPSLFHSSTSHSS